MSEYTFPFDTCEKPNKTGIAQPYSVFVNLITCSIVLYFVLKTKNNHSFFLLFSLLVFEFFHTFSHFIHIKGNFLFTITHIAGFLVNISFLNFLYNYTHILPKLYYLLFLFSILVLDAYSFLNLSFIYFVLTQIILFVAILYYYYPVLPKEIKSKIQLILLTTGLIYLGFVNEKLNCKSMLNMFPNFPFHVIIETLSIIPIYLLSSTFYNLTTLN
jgi:hypothetical protein